MTRAYERGLSDLGNGCWAWLQPDGSWGWSNAGLIADGDGSLLVDTLFDRHLTREMFGFACLLSGEDDNELIASVSGRKTVNEFGQDGSDLLKRPVACGMTVVVVDLLEVVEVDEQHRHRLLLARERSQLAVEPGAVGQAGQCVMVGLVACLHHQPREFDA